MNMAALLDEDRAARAHALEPASFIVEAPAGAGKTELLTQRYLRLLARVEAPEEIVAITFTNKAAAEMRSRILDSLARAAANDCPAEDHRRVTFELARAALAAGERQGWGLSGQPGRLRITTIDALCAGFARQMPFLSRFGAQPRLAEQAARHHAEAARRALAMLDETGAAADTVAEALRHLDNDTERLSRLLAEMLARRDQWLPHALRRPLREEAEEGFAALVRRDLRRAAAAFDPCRQAPLMPLACQCAANAAADSAIAALAGWAVPLADDPAQLPLWRGLRELLLTREGEPRKAWNRKQGVPPGKGSAPLKAALAAAAAALPPPAVAVLARVSGLPEPRYTEEEWRTVESLARLLELAAGQLWTVFNEAGEADFVEVAGRALQALGDEEAPTDLALALDYRIRHLLVDEFQDTSPTQVALLRRLTAGWAPDDGRTLFAVGDPMQSIYRFRKADVGLFLRVAELGIGGLALERLRLARNNRSCAEVVAWVNRAFAGIFPDEDSVAEGAIRYRPFAPTRAPLPDAGVFVHPLVAAREMSGAAAEALEAQRILAIIEQTRRADPQRRIAVLVRARSHLDGLVALIRRARPGLRFQAVEIEGLAARQPVQDLLSLTRALFHRADRVHWLAVLRAPWCGLTLADLFALAGDDHESTLWQLMQDETRVARLSPCGRRRLLHVRAVIGAAFAQRGRQRPRRWVEGVWLALGGAACLADATAAADARAYLDLIERLDAGGRFGLGELAREMERLYATPDAAAGGELQFMTIHKAKGLEFDTVILPGLHRGTGSGEQALMLWEEVVFEGIEEGLVAAPLKQRNDDGKNAATPYDYLRRLENERSANEDARVLYVAATRAIRALHLVGVARAGADGTLAVPAGTFLDLLWDAVAADFAAAAVAEGGGPSGNDANFAGQLVRLAEPAAPEFFAVPAAVAESVAPAADTADTAADRLAADVGTLVHAYLEMIARAGLAAWPPQRIAGLRGAMAAWLIAHGHVPAAAAEGATRAAEALRTTLASRDGQWVLAARAGAAAELPVSDCVGGRIATHVVDRSFVADGERWIIDYKTARVGVDETALQDHAGRYRAQLERYAALFAAEGRPLRLAVFYVAHGRLIEFQQASGS